MYFFSDYLIFFTVISVYSDISRLPSKPIHGTLSSDYQVDRGNDEAWMREKRTRGHEKSEPLFDYNLDELDPKQPIVVNFTGLTDDALSRLAARAKEDLKLDQSKDCQLLASNVPYASDLPISKSDPLSPDLFVGHHRRMEREERRMQVQERQQLTVMAARIRNQKEILTRPDWKNGIDKIVRIHNADDAEEARKKRDLTLVEMDNFLKKFEEYHRRCNRRENSGSASVKDTSKKPPTKVAPKTKISKSKLVNVKTKSKSPAPEPEALIIDIRPTAFGYMVPPRVFPPREFSLSPLVFSEVESLELVEKLARERKNKHIE